MDKGGNAPCVLNAANEVAVDLFLKERIGFLEMSDLIAHTLETVPFISKPELADLEASDAEARRTALESTPAWNLIKASQLLLSLSILVVLHEMGHFLPARWFKIRVEKFYLFFDPWFSLFKKKVGDTEYGVGWLPLGGYVKISGMVDESMDKEQMAKPPEPWEFRSKPAWQRLTMIGGVTVNLLLGMLIYIGVLFTWGREYLPAGETRFTASIRVRRLRHKAFKRVTRSCWSMA